jgi:hypothetical protein
MSKLVAYLEYINKILNKILFAEKQILSSINCLIMLLSISDTKNSSDQLPPSPPGTGIGHFSPLEGPFWPSGWLDKGAQLE